MRKTLLIALISVLLMGCQQGAVYNCFEEIPLSGWHADSAIVFEPNITDSVGDYQMLIHVRHSDRYAYQNLWLFVDIAQDSVLLRRDTIEAQMANARGEWYGGGISQYTLPLLYLEQITLAQGQYTVSIQQGMREDNLRAISEVGVKITKQE